MQMAEVVLVARSEGLRRADSDLRTLKTTGADADRSLGKSTTRMSAGMTNVGAAATNMAKMAARAFAVIGAGIVTGGAIRAQLQFGTAVAETSTLLAGNAREIAAVESASRDLAKTYGTTATAQAQAFYQAISAGATSAADATELLNTANRLAVGGVTDVTTAVGILSGVLNAYGRDVLSADEVSDTLFVGMKAGVTTVGELSSAIGRVLPAAQAVGLSFEEAVAATAALTKNSMTTAEAVTSLNAALTGIIRPTAEAQKLAKQLGIDFSSAALGAQGLGAFMADLAEKTGGNVEVMAQMFGSVEALKAALLFAGEAGGQYADIMEDMARKVGATSEAFDTMAQDDAHKMKVAMAELRDVMLSIGAVLVDIVVPAMQAVAWVITGVSDAIKGVFGWIRSFWEFGSALDTARDAADLMNLSIADTLEQVNAINLAQRGGRTVSLDYALAMLANARAAMAAANAIREQRLEQIKSSDAYQELIEKQTQLNSDIAFYQELLSDNPSAEALARVGLVGQTELHASMVQTTLNLMEGSLHWLRQTVAAQEELLGTAASTNAEYRSAIDEIAAYEAAIALVKDGMVTLGGETADAADTSAALARLLGEAGNSARDGADGAGVLAGALGTAERAAAGLMRTLGNVPAALALLGQSADGIVAELQRQNAELQYQTNAGITASAARIKVMRDEAVDMALAAGATLEQAAALGASFNEQAAAAEALTLENTGLADSLNVVATSGGGASAGITEVADAARDAAEAMDKELMRALGGVVDAFFDFMKRGFTDFKSFAKSILSGFGDMLINMAKMAYQNRITIPITTALTGGGSAASAGGLGGGGGMLSGLLGSFGSEGSIFGMSSLGMAGGTGLFGGLGNALSGGFGNIFNIGANAAAAGVGGTATFMSTLGAAAPIIAGVVALVSFFSTKTKQLDAGLRLTIDSTETLVESFNKVEKTRFWGLSKKISTTFDEVEAAISSPIQRAVDRIGASTLDMAEAIGLGAGALDDFSTQLTISTKDMDAESAQRAIQAALEGLFDEMAGTALGEAGRLLIEDGETAGDTLTRLSSAIVAVNSAFGMMNFALREISLTGAASASALVELMGGLDNFQNATGFFYQNFFSEQERVAKATEMMTATLAEFGLELPDTMAAFRALVEQSVADEANELTAALLAMAPNFDFIKKTVDEFNQATNQNSLFRDRAEMVFAQTAAAFQRPLPTELSVEERALLVEVVAAVREGNINQSRLLSRLVRIEERRELEPAL